VGLAKTLQPIMFSVTPGPKLRALAGYGTATFTLVKAFLNGSVDVATPIYGRLPLAARLEQEPIPPLGFVDPVF
jgi:hypothetical protein